MKFRLIALLLAIFPVIHGQLVKESIVGGRFFGEFSHADHLEWGNYCNISSHISFKLLTAFKTIDLSKVKTQSVVEINRRSVLFYGIGFSIDGYYTNSDMFYELNYVLFPAGIIKYYTPINLFFQSSIGFEFEQSKFGLNDPNVQTFSTPAVRYFGYVIEIHGGYSLDLFSRALLEPSISYKILRGNVSSPNNAEGFPNPINSINFNIGIYFIVNKYFE